MALKIFSFKGGIHPPDSKIFTENKPIEKAAIPKEISIPMQQHIGAPCEPVVKPGDYVRIGQKVGEPKGFVSAPVHSSISGTVRKIAPVNHSSGGKITAVIIENDGRDLIDESIQPMLYNNMTSDDIKAAILKAGIVGMGGATFPTHVKYSPPPDKKIDTVILNGAECEPYLTADYRMMLEKPKLIINGLKAIMKVLGVNQGFIGIENNKSVAIKIMKENADLEANIEIVPLRTKYPQGAEKQLIQVVTNRQVPSGGLPMDVGVVVNNVGTAAAIAATLETGMPLIERVVTVSGGAVREPKNLMVRIGTSFKDVIDQCGGLIVEPAKVIAGGPMMGLAQVSLDVPVIKGTSGILLLTGEEASIPSAKPCIRCGKCMEACPIRLSPLTISALSLNNCYEECEENNAMDCIECGCCTYICPAKRNLLQSIRVAKREILAERKRSKK